MVEPIKQRHTKAEKTMMTIKKSLQDEAECDVKNCAIKWVQMPD